MSETPKAYKPQSFESKWYQFWLNQQCFVADPARVPPPKVTDMLLMSREPYANYADHRERGRRFQHLKAMGDLLCKEEAFKIIDLCMEVHRELGKGQDEVKHKDALRFGNASFLKNAAATCPICKNNPR